jgi:predicted dehydrogenase
MKMKISAGVIGIGFGELHLQLLSQIETINIDWLCFHSNRSKAEKIASHYNIANVTSDYREVNRSGVEFIVVVTPVYTHFDIISDAIASGKHVVSDKPLALDQRECKELVKLVQQNPIKNMTFFQWRFNNVLLTLRSILDEKGIGEIYSFNTTFYTDFMADESIPYLWRHDKNRAGMGVMTDMGVHLIDLLYWLTRGDMTIGHAVSKSIFPYRKADKNENIKVSTEDFSNVQYRLSLPAQSDSAIGTMTVCRTAHGLSKMEFIILGTKGSILVQINPFTGEGSLFMNNKKIELKYHNNENPYFHWINYLQGKEVAIPTFEDGLKSQKIIDELKAKLL